MIQSPSVQLLTDIAIRSSYYRVTYCDQVPVVCCPFHNININCNLILITVQRDATQSSLFIILQVHSTCFGCQPHPSSGVHKTVTTASSTGHTFCAATSLQRGQASLATLEGGSCTVPEAVVTVLCTPDYGCGRHPKHVE